MATIHVNRGTTSLGTFSDEEVREGLRTARFLATDLGWREGMPSWKQLSQFPEFGGTVAPSPVPPPSSVGSPSTSVASASAAAVRTEPLAIWSFVLSILGLACCGFVLGVPAVICGHLALSKFQKEPHLQGKGLATAGLIIGYVAIAFWLIYIVFFGGIAALRELTHSS